MIQFKAHLNAVYCIFSMLTILFVAGCRGGEGSSDAAKSIVEPVEMAQQVGDFMALMDEAAGNRNGNFSFVATSSCASADLTTCDSVTNTITKNYNSCTSSTSTVQNTLTLKYAGTNAATCALSANTDVVDVLPNYSVTNSEGVISQFSKVGAYAYRVSYVSGSAGAKNFSVTSAGAKKTMSSSGSTLYDMSIFIPTAISVQNSTRTDRRINSGTLRITNNLTSEQCDLTPSAVAWTGAQCNCPTTGQWSGTCQQQGAFSLVINSCTRGTLTFSGKSYDVTFNRCESL